MNEPKFLIYGEFIRPNGYQNYDLLGYIAPTREDAIANCRRNNPHFHIITVREENWWTTLSENSKNLSIKW